MISRSDLVTVNTMTELNNHEQPRGLVVSRYCLANAHAPMPLIARAFAESLSLASLADDPRCVLTIGLVKGISCFMS